MHHPPVIAACLCKCNVYLPSVWVRWLTNRKQNMVQVDMREAVPDEESWDLSCNILSKNLRLSRSKDSVNTAHYLVHSRLINTRFVSNNNRAPPPYVYLTSCTWLFQAFPLRFAYCKQSKTVGGNGLGMRLCKIAGWPVQCTAGMVFSSSSGQGLCHAYHLSKVLY